MIQAKIPTVSTTPPFLLELDAARGGDAQALAKLADRFYPTVQRIVHSRLESDLRRSRPWLAAHFSTGDVVQDVFYRIIQDINSFVGSTEEAFIGYLAMIVRNRIIDAVRFHEAECRDGRRTGRGDAELNLPGPGEGPADEAVTAELQERLREALKQFDQSTQLLLRARIEGQSTFAELAGQLGFDSESGARRAFYVAQARLALLLKEA